MAFFATAAGLSPNFASPAEEAGTQDVVTEEAAVCAPPGPSLAVTPLVSEGETVARGAAVACLRHAPDVCLVAPIAGRVARIELQPGRRLSRIVLFREDTGPVERHDPGPAATEAGLRRLMHRAGMWPWLRRRPFGGMPAPDERPAAIMVMAADTRPFAPDARAALYNRHDDLTRGLAALGGLTDGPVILCQASGAPLLPRPGADSRLRLVTRADLHPQGSPGICVHHLCPAGLDAPVWDLHAEDAAALGALLETGELPVMRLVRIAGAGLRSARSLRTHPGADLRQLTRRIVAPGPHQLLSGSPLDGETAHWLGQRDRQVTVLPRAVAPRRPHWLIAALTRSAAAMPVIPTAALAPALGGALPAVPLLRALGAGDEETAMKLGVLSLLEEDLALADYVLAGTGGLATRLRAMLDHVAAEFAA